MLKKIVVLGDCQSDGNNCLAHQILHQDNLVIDWSLQYRQREAELAELIKWMLSHKTHQKLALQTISEKCGIVMISIQPALYAGTTEIQFACSASAFSWGSDAPPYSVPPANMPEDLTAAATEMTLAVQAIPDRPIHTVYYGGCATQQTAPIDNVVPVSFGGIVITEVPFVLV